MEDRQRAKILDHQRLYSGRIIALEVDRLEIEGRETIREVVRHPGGAVLLGIRDDGRIPFVRQLRYPMQESLLELPAGKLDGKEDPAIGAAREMEEETGLRPIEVRHMASFYSSPGFCDELLHLYFSPKLIQTTPQTEFDEDLEVVFLTLEEALEMTFSGQIRDAKTLVGILWLAANPDYA